MSNTNYFFIDARASGTGTFSVWQDTNITIEKGESIKISCNGYASSLYSAGTTKPNICQPQGIDAKLSNSLVPSVEVCAAVAKIGTDGTPVKIGTDGSITAQEKGILYLGFNDSIATDNAGGYFATIVQPN